MIWVLITMSSYAVSPDESRPARQTASRSSGRPRGARSWGRPRASPGARVGIGGARASRASISAFFSRIAACLAMSVAMRSFVSLSLSRSDAGDDGDDGASPDGDAGASKDRRIAACFAISSLMRRFVSVSLRASDFGDFAGDAGVRSDDDRRCVLGEGGAFGGDDVHLGGDDGAIGTPLSDEKLSDRGRAAGDAGGGASPWSSLTRSVEMRWATVTATDRRARGDASSRAAVGVAPSQNRTPRT